MWRIGAMASLGILSLASPAFADHPDERATVSIRIGGDRDDRGNSRDNSRGDRDDRGKSREDDRRDNDHRDNDRRDNDSRGHFPRYEYPRYQPKRIELPRIEWPRPRVVVIEHRPRPEPRPVFVPHYTNLSTRTQIDGRWVIVSATLWRDECGHWNASAKVIGDDRCDLPPIISANLAVKSDHRWWRTDLDRAGCDPRAATFAADAGPDWGCDGDARVCVHLVTPGGRHMIQWDDVRVD
ncbi:MAG: hypothetical protein GC200_06520 [Tepidisphaera sp.]|nr:hypothetical protein [Tepidisphaera sp.]